MTGPIEISEALELTPNRASQVKEKVRFKAKHELPFAIGTPALIWQAIFFYLPLLFMMLTSIMSISEEGFIKGLTLDNFRYVMNFTHFTIIFQSLALGLVTGISCLLIGFPFAYFIAFRGGRYRNLLLFFLIVPFWTNFLLHVCAWFFVLERNGFLNNLLLAMNWIDAPLHFLNSSFSIMIMMIYHYLPFMVLPLFSSFEKLNPVLLEASSDLGASFGQTFKRVMLPLTMPAIRLGFFLVYIPSFGEFVIPELMGGDKHYFVGNVVTQYMLGDQSGPLGAAFTVLSCIFLVVTITILNWLSKRLNQHLIGGN